MAIDIQIFFWEQICFLKSGPAAPGAERQEKCHSGSEKELSNVCLNRFQTPAIWQDFYLQRPPYHVRCQGLDNYS